MKIVSLTSLGSLADLLSGSIDPHGERHSFCLRCKQEIYGGIFKRGNTSQNSKPQAKGCYIHPWHNFLFNMHKRKNTRIFPWVWSSECAKTKSCSTFFFPPLTTVFRILGDEEEDDVYSERVCIFLERLSRASKDNTALAEKFDPYQLVWYKILM